MRKSFPREQLLYFLRNPWNSLSKRALCITPKGTIEDFRKTAQITASMCRDLKKDNIFVSVAPRKLGP